MALARALVRRPAAFLMDEPLGALDAEFRETMRAEIKRLHIAQHATTVYVTHDQIEAMAMGDRIVVMSEAVVQQVGTPAEVYHNPANLFVARFIGSPGMNLINGALCRWRGSHCRATTAIPCPTAGASLCTQLLQTGEVIVGFRPEAAGCHENGALPAQVYATDMHGALYHAALNLDARPDRPCPRRAARSVTRSARPCASTSTRRWCVSSIPQTENGAAAREVSHMSNVDAAEHHQAFQAQSPR